MIQSENSRRLRAPGIEPRWTSSAKEGLGTAYHTSCRVWFTLSHGIVNEIYYPTVDQPNTRDFQFLISDGETFCHEEKRDLDHQIEYPERDCPFYRLTNSEQRRALPDHKHVLADPHRSVVVMHTRIEVVDESLRGKLRLYALLAPHLGGKGPAIRAGAPKSAATPCCTRNGRMCIWFWAAARDFRGAPLAMWARATVGRTSCIITEWIGSSEPPGKATSH